jgi:hypothetical protein
LFAHATISLLKNENLGALAWYGLKNNLPNEKPKRFINDFSVNTRAMLSNGLRSTMVLSALIAKALRHFKDNGSFCHDSSAPAFGGRNSC